MPAKPLLDEGAAPQVEIDAVGAGIAQVGKDARRLGEGRPFEHLVQQVVAEVGFGGIAVQAVEEVLPLIVETGIEIQLGVFSLQRLDARSATGDKTDVQVLEAVVFVIVEPGHKHARRNITVVLPAAPHRTGDGAVDVLDSRRAVDLVEVERERTTARAAGGGERRGERIAPRIAVGVWEDGKMNKQAYRKFKVMTVLGVDDFASMREVVTRRYRRLLDQIKAPQGTSSVSGHDFSRADNAPEFSGALAPEARSSKSKEPTTLPSLILIDGGLGQLHAAAEALESLGLTSQPLASIAKREEVIYLHGNEDEPIVLDRRSPVLHLIQLIRDESHRFAIGYHRQCRAMRDRDSELLNIPGVGPQTRQRLLTHFGSLRDVQQATAESLAAVVPRKTAETIWRHFHETQPAT